MSLRFYVYAYVSYAGKPYYIGKGKNNRAWEKHTNIKKPNDKAKIIILENNLSEIGAWAIERRMIAWWGRKDLGTGILQNQSDGGEGNSGAICKPETRLKMSQVRKGRESHRKGKIGTFTTGSRTAEQKQHQIDISPKRIEIKIDDVIYKSIEQAAKSLGILAKTVGCRSKNPNFPNYIRLEKYNA